MPGPDDPWLTIGALRGFVIAATSSVAASLEGNDARFMDRGRAPRLRCEQSMYNDEMGRRAIHISEAEAAKDLHSLLARVRAGAEIVIERDAEAVAVIRPAEPQVRLLSESLRLAKERGSKSTLDGDFARDLEKVVRRPCEPTPGRSHVSLGQRRDARK